MAGVRSCKDCKDRHVGCHSTCEKYKKEKEELDRINDKARADREYGRATGNAKEWYHRTAALKGKNTRK